MLWSLHYRQSYVVYSLSFTRFALSKVFFSENAVSIEVKFHMMGEKSLFERSRSDDQDIFLLLSFNSLLQLLWLFCRIREEINSRGIDVQVLPNRTQVIKSLYTV